MLLGRWCILSAIRRKVLVQPLDHDADTLALLRFEVALTTDDVGVYTWGTAGAAPPTRITSNHLYGLGGWGISLTAAQSGQLLINGLTTVPSGGFPQLCIESWQQHASGTGTLTVTLEGHTGAAFNGKSTGFSVNSNTNVVTWVAYDDAGNNIFLRTPAHTVGTSYKHYAVTFDGSTYRLFAAGTQIDSFSSSTKPGGGSKLFTSGLQQSGTFVGRMDNVRWSKTARYTSAFTPVNVAQH